MTFLDDVGAIFAAYLYTRLVYATGKISVAQETNELVAEAFALGVTNGYEQALVEAADNVHRIRPE